MRAHLLFLPRPIAARLAPAVQPSFPSRPQCCSLRTRSALPRPTAGGPITRTCRFSTGAPAKMSLPTTMNAVGINKTGDFDVIEKFELPVPQPAPGDVLVKVRLPTPPLICADDDRAVVTHYSATPRCTTRGLTSSTHTTGACSSLRGRCDRAYRPPFCLRVAGRACIRSRRSPNHSVRRQRARSSRSQRTRLSSLTRSTSCAGLLWGETSQWCVFRGMRCYFQR